MKNGTEHEPLESYLAATDASFRWERLGAGAVGKCQTTELRITSQTWRGIPWRHHLVFIQPHEMVSGTTALLLVTADRDRGEAVAHLARAAEMTGRPAAVLYDVPNQPLFEGRVEDEIIAYTFARYLETGDETWPLLFPMVRSVQAAMTALQQLTAVEESSGKTYGRPVERFVITGASKRGWTTWLTAARDERAAGIAPRVFNNLNMIPQMRHQIATWAGYSHEISDYEREGVLQQIDTPRGRALCAMVDPYTFRADLALPKLLIHGSNDRYWPLDAADFYFDELPGVKHLLTVPNSGHALEDSERVLASLSAFFAAVATGRSLPVLDARFSGRGWDCRIDIRSSTEPASLRVWTAEAAGSDFRDSVWGATPIVPAAAAHYTASLPSSGRLAMYAEAEYTLDGIRYSLSSPLAILPSVPHDRR